MLTFHQWGLVAFTWGQFYREHSWYLSLIWVWTLLIYDFNHVSHSQWANYNVVVVPYFCLLAICGDPRVIQWKVKCLFWRIAGEFSIQWSNYPYFFIIYLLITENRSPITHSWGFRIWPMFCSCCHAFCNTCVLCYIGQCQGSFCVCTCQWQTMLPTECSLQCDQDSPLYSVFSANDNITAICDWETSCVILYVAFFSKFINSYIKLILLEQTLISLVADFFFFFFFC